MLHFLFIHWKGEAIISAIAIAFYAMLAIWDSATTERMLLSTIVSAGIGYFVWWLQKRQTDKRLKAQEAITLKRIQDEKDKADAAQREAVRVREERDRIAEGHKELLATVATLRLDFTRANQKLEVMNQTVVPMYEAMKLKMVQILTHPHAEFKVPDELLAVVSDPKGRLSAPQMDKLEALLRERERDTHPDVTAEERLAARALPIIIKLAAIEEQTKDPVVAIQLVSTTVREKVCES